jgi:hypothetical protein
MTSLREYGMQPWNRNRAVILTGRYEEEPLYGKNLACEETM